MAIYPARMRHKTACSMRLHRHHFFNANTKSSTVCKILRRTLLPVYGKYTFTLTCLLSHPVVVRIEDFLNLPWTRF